MASIIILGDPHIGKGLSIGKTGVGSAWNSRIVDQMKLLDWTLEQAIEHHAAHIVITGDVFEDPKPHPSLIVTFISWVKKCEANGITLHVIAGNHDILRSGTFTISPLDIISECEIEGCHIYKELSTVIIDSVAFTFLPFRDRKSFICDSNANALEIMTNSLQYELAAIPLVYSKVLIGHLALEGSIHVGDEFDDISNELFCPLNMFSGYDYVWMGHVHKPQVLRKTPHIAHIGSMDLSNFGETEHKKIIIVFDTDKLIFSELELPTRPLQKITINVPKDTSDTTQYVTDEISKKYPNLDKSIVKVEISLTSPDLPSVDRSAIEKYLYKSGVYNVSALSESKKLSLIKKSSASPIDTTMDVPAAIKMWAENKYPLKKDESRKKRYIELAMSMLAKYKETKEI